MQKSPAFIFRMHCGFLFLNLPNFVWLRVTKIDLFHEHSWTIQMSPLLKETNRSMEKPT